MLAYGETKRRIIRALKERWPDRTLPRGSMTALAREFGCTPTYIQRLASEAGFHKAGQSHGTRAMFVNEKCRCKPCVAANNEYQRAYRHQKAVS